ncbi:RagB/SusD family nutrient uptake outer membrane protein [Reichenbachiella carrageenanivorans]|uniref:RagB/SusD family nutrient uptake outer membrane protein n=1 Tax=Reichenbachiella carrageenanivorans TaxID=2979869 RepID=A0ABY6D5X5_9BACT|nr:RagB/SusD family nutrient uptake outer membrane protein [Reichenbachiella carrageenanivorans]UXX81000.1 RagB/SusD family nutrient uptake outer membrane protein [Reichenbachiella carrageenanivorans]
MNRYINKIYTCIATTMMVVIGAGCTSFEDVNPTNEFPGNEVGESTYNIELVLNEGYLAWSQSFCSQHLPVANLLADYTEAITGEQSLGGSYENLYEFDRGVFHNDGQWSSAYKAINQANMVLDFTENTDPIDELYLLQRDRFRGEAWFIRAYAYFLLIRYYGEQYNTAGLSKPGVVLRTTPATGFDAGGRASVGEVYSQILSDLDSAEKYLPLTFTTPDNDYEQFPVFQFRAKRFDALSLKAKVQFQMNEMNQCLLTLQKVIGFLPGSIVITPKVAPADVMSILADSVANFYFTQYDVNAKLRQVSANFTVSGDKGLMVNIDGITNEKQSVIFLTDQFIDLYLDANGVVKGGDGYRMNNFVFKIDIEDLEGVVVDSSRYIFNKFVLDAESNTSWPTLRLEELLLMRAEAWALTNQASAAVKDLNYLKSLRKATPVSLSLSRVELLDAIAQDRMLELVGEGERFFNWKRMGAYNELIESVYSPEVYSSYDRLRTQNIVWNHPGTLLRIPQTEITRNTDLTDADQNP